MTAIIWAEAALMHTLTHNQHDLFDACNAFWYSTCAVYASGGITVYSCVCPVTLPLPYRGVPGLNN